jgi:hypothetical protein
MDTQLVDFFTHSVYIDGENLASILSQALGFTLNKTQAQTFASAILSSTTSGDIDSDGLRTKEDIEVIIQYLHGKQLLTDTQKNIADVNGDNIVRVNDIVAIQKLIAEAYIPHTPTASMTMTPTASPTVSVTATPSMTFTHSLDVPVNTPSPTSTYTPTPTVSSTMSPTPTLTLTETPSPTETPEPNLLTLEGTGTNAGVYINTISSVQGRNLGGFTVVLSGNVNGSVAPEYVMGSSQGFTYDAVKNVTIISGVSKVLGGTTIDDQRIINITSQLDDTTLMYSDSRFMVSDQYGRVMNPRDYPSLTMELVSANTAKVTLRPYTIYPHNNAMAVSNFQFDYSGIRLKHMSGINPLRGYNISVGESRVLIFTMQVDKYSIPLDVNRSYTFEFEYDSLINIPHIRSAMFVDSGINLASYALMHPSEPELMFSQSVPYAGVDQELDESSPFMMNMANITTGRDTFYYGDLTSSTDPAVWIGSTAWLPIPDVDGKVDSDNDINTGHINVDDLTLALRMFVDAQLYNGTRAINQSTAQTESENIYVTRMQQLLVYADRTDTQNMYSTAATYTVNGNSLDLYDPPATFNLSKLRHILKMVSLALNTTNVVEYEGVVDAHQNDYGNIVVKVSGQDTKIRVYFTNPDGSLLGNGDLGDSMDFQATSDYYSNKTYTIPFPLFSGFVYGTDELRVTGIDDSNAVGMYVNVTTEAVFTETPTMTHTFTPTMTITGTIGDIVVDYSIPPSVVDDVTKDNVYTFKVASAAPTPEQSISITGGSFSGHTWSTWNYSSSASSGTQYLYTGGDPVHDFIYDYSRPVGDRYIDGGSSYPDDFVQTGDQVFMYNTSTEPDTLIMSFADPYYADPNDAIIAFDINSVTVNGFGGFDVTPYATIEVINQAVDTLLTPNYMSDPDSGIRGKNGSANGTYTSIYDGPTLYNNTTYDFTSSTIDANQNPAPEITLTSTPSAPSYGRAHYLFNESITTKGGANINSWTVPGSTGELVVDFGSLKSINRIQFFVGKIGTAGSGTRNPSAQSFSYSTDNTSYTNLNLPSKNTQGYDDPPFEYDETFNTVDARYIKINVSNSSVEVGLSALFIYGPIGSTIVKVTVPRNPAFAVKSIALDIPEEVPPTFDLFKNGRELQATVADDVYTLPVASPTLSFVAENKMRIENIPLPVNPVSTDAEFDFSSNIPIALTKYGDTSYDATEKALFFPETYSTENYVRYDTSSTISGNEFSVSFSIKLKKLGSNYAEITHWWRTGTDANHANTLQLYYNGVTLRFQGPTKEARLDITLPIDTWLHFTVVNAATSPYQRLYMNGIPVVFTSDATGSLQNTISGNTMYFGNNDRMSDNGNNRNMNGYMKDIKIFDRVLSDAEVASSVAYNVEEQPTFSGYLLNNTTGNHVKIDDIPTASIEIPIIETGNYTFIANNTELDSEMHSNSVIVSALAVPSGDVSSVTGTNVTFNGFDEMTVTTTGTNLNLGYRTAIVRDAPDPLYTYNELTIQEVPAATYVYRFDLASNWGDDAGAVSAAIFREIDAFDADGNAIAYESSDLITGMSTEGISAALNDDVFNVNNFISGPDLTEGFNVFTLTLKVPAHSIRIAYFEDSNWGVFKYDVYENDASRDPSVQITSRSGTSEKYQTFTFTASRQSIAMGAAHDLASRVTFDGAPAFNLEGTSVVSVAKVTEPGVYAATSQGTNAETPVTSAPLPEIKYAPVEAPSPDAVASTVTDATIAFDGFNKLTVTATNETTVESFGYSVERSTSASGPWTGISSGIATFPTPPGKILGLTYESSTLGNNAADVVPSGVTVTSDHVWSTTQKKYGSYSGDYTSGSKKTTIAGLTYPNDFTVSGWFYIPSSGSVIQTLFASDGYSAENGSWTLYVDLVSSSNRFFYFAKNVSGTLNSGVTTETIPRDKWIHISFCAATLEFYLDGIALDISTTSYSATEAPATTSLDVDTSDDILVGFNYHVNTSGANFFTGYIDQVEIYDGPLTAAEVSSIYSTQQLPVVGATKDVEITEAGFYRAVVQGTAGGAAVTAALANEIIYTPTLIEQQQIPNPKFTGPSTIVTDEYWEDASGWTASASSYNGHFSVDAYNAFDGGLTNVWHTAGDAGGVPAWLSIEYPESTVIKSYDLTNRNNSTNNYWPNTFKLQGSNDGTNWNDIGDAQNPTSWNQAETKTFDVSFNKTPYNVYRIYVTASKYATGSGTSVNTYDDSHVVIAKWQLNVTKVIPPSTVSSATLTFDGFNTLSVTPTGTNIVDGWGYAVEHSVTVDGPWTPVDSGIATGTAKEVVITKPGHYRARAQGTDGGAATVSVSLANEIVYTPLKLAAVPLSVAYYPLTSEPSNLWSETTDVTYTTDGMNFNSLTSKFGIDFTVPTGGTFTASCNFLKTTHSPTSGVAISSVPYTNMPELEMSFSATEMAFRASNVGYKNITGLTNNLNQWYHLVWIHSPTFLKAFIDGVEVYSYEGVTSSTETSFTFGHYLSGDNDFGVNGKMADVRIYDTAISDTEAVLIYNTDNKYTTVAKLSTVNSTTLTFDGFNTLSVTPTGTNIVDGWGYAVEHSVTVDGPWTPVDSGIATGTAKELTITKPGHYRARAQGTDGGAATVSVSLANEIIYTPMTFATIPEDHIAMIDFETAEISLDAGYGMTIVENTSIRSTDSFNTGQYSGQFRNGYTDKISLNNFKSGDFTISVWMNITSQTTSNIVFGTQNNDGTTTYGFALHLMTNTTNIYDFRLYGFTGANWGALFANTVDAEYDNDRVNLVYGQWVHIVLTNDHLYINNSRHDLQSGIYSIDEQLSHQTTQRLVFGACNDITTNKMNGYLDDSFVYDRKLSDEEVEKLYTTNVTNVIPPSTVSSATLTFDGFNTLSVTPTGPTVDQYWGYAVERSTTASGPWTAVDSGVATGASKDVTITEAGFYRAKAQGTDGGAATGYVALANEIVYTPIYQPVISKTEPTLISSHSAAHNNLTYYTNKGDFPDNSMGAHNVLSNGDKVYISTDGGSSRDPAQVFTDNTTGGWEGYASHGSYDASSGPVSWAYKFTSGVQSIGKISVYQPLHHFIGDINISWYDGTTAIPVTGVSSSGFGSGDNVASQELDITFDNISTQFLKITCFPHPDEVTKQYVGLYEWKIFNMPDVYAGVSKITDATLTFNGFNTLSVTPTGTNLVNGFFGYSVERATTASGPWTAVDSGVATGESKDVTITEAGFYRAKAQGTDGGAATGYVALANEIVYTPLSSSPQTTTELVFHHGNYNNEYVYANVTEASVAGCVFADTPLGTYTWGVLTVNTLASTGTTYTWTPTNNITTSALIVAGGGGGGYDLAGGGGAGGFLEVPTITLNGQSTIVVGNGSNGSTGLVAGSTVNGHNSSINSETAIGGGGGASTHNTSSYPAGNGGSGGGGSGGRAHYEHYGGERGTGTPGQGFDGARSGTTWYPGGGGGAGELGYGRDGTQSSNTTTGHGGDGKSYVLNGVEYWFSGGGGAAGHGNLGGNGGKGGGGGGSTYDGPKGLGDTNGILNASDGIGASGEYSGTNKGGDAANHTGGGGGGGSHATGGGGNGGSGIVIIIAPSTTTTTTSTTSTLTNTTLTFDGFNKLTVTPTGTNIVNGFGYSVERAASTDGVWNVVDSGIATGATKEVTITQPGFYRARAQGTDGGAAVVDALPMEIDYDPKDSVTKYQYVGYGGMTDMDVSTYTMIYLLKLTKADGTPLLHSDIETFTILMDNGNNTNLDFTHIFEETKELILPGENTTTGWHGDGLLEVTKLADGTALSDHATNTYVAFYFKLKEPTAIIDGAMMTYDRNKQYGSGQKAQWKNAKAFGSNTDPSTFSSPHTTSDWVELSDVTQVDGALNSSNLTTTWTDLGATQPMNQAALDAFDASASLTYEQGNKYELFQNFGTSGYVDAKGRTIENISTYSGTNLSATHSSTTVTPTNYTNTGWTNSGIRDWNDSGYAPSSGYSATNTVWFYNGAASGYIEKVLPSYATHAIVNFKDLSNGTTARVQIYDGSGTLIDSVTSDGDMKEYTLSFTAGANNTIRLVEDGGIMYVSHILVKYEDTTGVVYLTNGPTTGTTTLFGPGLGETGAEMTIETPDSYVYTFVVLQKATCEDGPGRVNAPAGETTAHFVYVNYVGIEESHITLNTTPTSGSVSDLFNESTNLSWYKSAYAVGDTLFTITTPFEIKNFHMSWNRPVYKPQFMIKMNGQDLYTTEYETVIETPSPYPVDYVFPELKQSYTLATPQTGEYYAIATESGAMTFAMNAFFNIGTSLAFDGFSTLTVTAKPTDQKIELYRNTVKLADLVIPVSGTTTTSVQIGEPGTYYAVRTISDGSTFRTNDADVTLGTEYIYGDNIITPHPSAVNSVLSYSSAAANAENHRRYQLANDANFYYSYVKMSFASQGYYSGDKIMDPSPSNISNFMIAGTNPTTSGDIIIRNQPTDSNGANIPSQKIFLSGYTLGARLNGSGGIQENWNHPKTWNLYGSTNDTSWTLLDQKVGFYFTETSHSFEASSNEAYDYFKLEILAISALDSSGNASADQRIQLGYISFSGSETRTTTISTELAFDDINTLTLSNIPADATSVELFRDTGSGSEKLTDMEIVTDPPASEYVYEFKVKASGSSTNIDIDEIYNLFDTDGGNINITMSNIDVHGTGHYIADSANLNTLVDGTKARPYVQWQLGSQYSIGDAIFTLTLNKKIGSMFISYNAANNVPEFDILENGVSILFSSTESWGYENGYWEVNYSFPPPEPTKQASIQIGTDGDYRAKVYKESGDVMSLLAETKIEVVRIAPFVPPDMYFTTGTTLGNNYYAPIDMTLENVTLIFKMRNWQSNARFISLSPNNYASGGSVVPSDMHIYAGPPASDGGNGIFFRTGNDGGLSPVTSHGYKTDEWTYVVYKYTNTGSETTMYVNGVSAASNHDPQSVTEVMKFLNLGRHPYHESTYFGDFEYIAVFDTALDNAVIESIKADNSLIMEHKPHVYLKFNGDLLDSSGNGRHMVAVTDVGTSFVNIDPLYVAPQPSTELAFDDINTLTLTNIPEGATSVELFRDTGSGSVKLTDMEILTAPPIEYHMASAPPIVLTIANELAWTNAFLYQRTVSSRYYVYLGHAGLPQHEFRYDWVSDVWEDVGSDDPAPGTIYMQVIEGKRMVTGWRAIDSQWNSEANVADQIIEFEDPYYNGATIEPTKQASIQIGTTGTYQAFAYDSLDRLLVETPVVTVQLPEIKELTNDLLQWPPVGTIDYSSIANTGGNAANSTNSWTVTADYGTGTYKATQSTATDGRNSFAAFNKLHGESFYNDPNGTQRGECFHNNSGQAAIVSLDLPEDVVINRYALWSRTGDGNNFQTSVPLDETNAIPHGTVEQPRAWTIEGSINGSSWTVLDTQTEQSTITMKREYDFENTTKYRHYRINVTATGGGTVVFGELQFFGPQLTTSTELAFDDINTLTLSNIPADATSVELFRDTGSGSVKLTDMYVATESRIAEVHVGANGSYHTIVKKIVDDKEYILSETVPLTVDTFVDPNADTPAGVSTLVFHHGNFDDAHGDGDAATALVNGNVYADSPFTNFTQGTLSAVTTSDETTYTWTPDQDYLADTLAVAGGGGGGGDIGGGGGAGGYLESLGLLLRIAAQTIVVGRGGFGRRYDGYENGGSKGVNSSFGSMDAEGGGMAGAGHSTSYNAGSGGSGGGSNAASGNTGPGTGVLGQGHVGGNQGGHWWIGGGGGAGEAGGGGGVGIIGNGGDGKAFEIRGTEYWFAGGGGAGGHTSEAGGRGGKGGGGGGTSYNQGGGGGGTNGITNGTNGVSADSATGGSAGAHTGGGGGGGSHYSSSGGNGGSGIVVIRTPSGASTDAVAPTPQQTIPFVDGSLWISYGLTQLDYQPNPSTTDNFVYAMGPNGDTNYSVQYNHLTGLWSDLNLVENPGPTVIVDGNLVTFTDKTSPHGNIFTIENPYYVVQIRGFELSYDETTAQLVVEDIPSAELGDIVPDEYKIFRDGNLLSVINVSTDPTRISIGKAGVYHLEARKTIDGTEYLLIETPNVVVAPVMVSEISAPTNGPLPSTTTNTDATGSTSNKSTATPASGTDYIYLTHENEPRFATHITAGYSGLKWTSDTATLYLKFTTSSSVTQGSLFMSDSNYDGNGPDAPLFEHWWDANAKNMQLMIANSSNTHAVSANIYYDLQPDTTYEWVYHFGPNGYFDVIVNGVQVPVAQQNGSGPYYIQVGVYGTNITSSVQHSTSGTVKDVTFADIVFPRIGYVPGGSAQWTMDAFGMFNQHIAYDDFVSTAVTFDGNTLNVTNIPATANKVELFRDGSLWETKALGASDTSASMRVFATGIYTALLKNGEFLVSELPTINQPAINVSNVSFDQTVTKNSDGTYDVSVTIPAMEYTSVSIVSLGIAHVTANNVDAANSVTIEKTGLGALPYTLRFVKNDIAYDTPAGAQLTIEGNTLSTQVTGVSQATLFFTPTGETTEQSFDMGTFTSTQIGQTGDYRMEFVTSTGFEFTNKVSVESIAGSFDAPLAFHHGNFDDHYADGTVAAAAENGRVYADTAPGTYAWGNLDSATTTTPGNTMPFSVIDIIDITGYQGWDTYYYQYDSVDGDVYRYILKFANGNDVADATNSDHSIDYDRSTGKWSDGGGGSPVTVTHSGTMVTGTQAGATLFTIDDPYGKISGTTYDWTPAGAMTADVLMVAGGGSGPSPPGWNVGGGGAGGYISQQIAISSAQQTIVVGNGGVPTGVFGENGANSSAFGLSAVGGGGGGGGGDSGENGIAGGSGGGGSQSGGNGTSGGAGTAGQGNAGGSVQSTYYGGGGGGGAGTAGSGGTAQTLGGNGGDGLLWEPTGVYYASGGGGSNHHQATTQAGFGGIGGGGNGGYSSTDATDGEMHKGSGGGGGGEGRAAGSGGSGIVLIAFPKTPSLAFDGANKLTIENAPANASITIVHTKDGVTTQTDVGTATEIVVNDTGDYSVSIMSPSVYVMSTNVETVSAIVNPIIIQELLHVANTTTTGATNIVPTITHSTCRSSNDIRYLLYSIRTISDSTTLDVFEDTSGGSDVWIKLDYGSIIYVSKITLQAPSRSSVPNTSTQSCELYVSLDDLNYNYVGNVSMTADFPNTFDIIIDQKPARYVKIQLLNNNIEGLGRFHVFGSLIAPTTQITFDNYNKLTIENPPANATTTLKFTPTGSTDTQEIDTGTATEFTIAETGTYSVLVKSGSSFFMSDNVVVSEINTQLIYSRFEEVEFTLQATSPGNRLGIGNYPSSNWIMYYSDNSPVIYTYTINNLNYIISTDGFGYTNGPVNVFINDNSHWFNKNIAINDNVDNNYIMIEYPVITPINGYVLNCVAEPTYRPTGWKIYGVMSDETHVEIDSQVSFDASTFTTGDIRFDFDNTHSYKSYKIKVTSRNGGQYNWININKFLPFLNDVQTPVLTTTLAFDGFNKLTIENPPDDVTGITLTHGGVATYIGTATEIIINETGDYSLSIMSPDVYIASTNSVTVGAVSIPVGYRYLAFLGDGFSAGVSRGTFHELELALNTPLGGFNNIKFGEMLPVSTPVETKAWIPDASAFDYTLVFNSDKTYNAALYYYDSTAVGSVLFYFDMGDGNYADVSGGDYWTYSQTDYAINSGKLYGTHTDPATFSDADRIDPSKYTFICDLTKNTGSGRKEIQDDTFDLDGNVDGNVEW